MSETISAPPIVIGTTGPVPTPPATLNALLISLAQTLAPGLTADLPASLIEDISSTDTGALVIANQVVVDLINSVSPLTANPYILYLLAQVYGVMIGQGSYTSVSVVFSGPPGFPITPGYIVSDGTYQYVIIGQGAVIGSSGQTTPLTAVATVAGSWAVPAGTVTQIVTSIPVSITPTPTVTNPFAGTPSQAAPTEEQTRQQVLQAGLATATGVPALCKTALNNIEGVDPTLVSIRMVTAGQWEVIVGGSGDPYLIGEAIFNSFGDISTLVGSVMQVTGITNANPGVVTVNLNHGFSTGQVIQINGTTGISGINGVNLTITVLTETTFSIGINTTSSGTWTGGGVVTPNFRNQTVAIYNYPDTYTIPFVVPPSQAVTMTVTWNTSDVSFTGAASIALAAAPAIATYINGLSPGQPINVLDLEDAFRVAIADILPPSLITRLIFEVAINGIGTAPETGEVIIVGDPESFFTTNTSAIAISQG